MIQILRIEPLKNPEIVREIVSIYQNSFGNEPWNEGHQCPVCGHTIPLGTTDSSYCSVCTARGNRVPMIAYWPLERVLGDFYREMGKRDAVCVVAREGEKSVGFAWRYKLEMGKSTDTYLEAPGLHTLREGWFPYLDEVAVSLPYRQRGIGELLVQTIKRSGNGQPLLLRTKNNSPMSRLVEKMCGSILLSISQERIIAEIP